MSNIPLSALTAFANHPAVNGASGDMQEYVPVPDIFPDIVFNDTAWLGNRDRHLLCRTGPSGYYLSIPQIGVFRLAEKQASVNITVFPDTNDSTLLEEIILGPLMMLALATQGRFALHASSAVMNDHLYVFVGESGRGKSTLAASIQEQGGMRVSDDVLPLSVENDRLYAWPRYPQLKLTASEQYPDTYQQKCLLNNICVLLESSEQITLTPLSPSKSLLSILGNTVAVRLFNKQLVSDHLEFCQRGAGSCTVYELSYPRIRYRLGEVHTLLASQTP